MGALTIAFDITLVGALALPWVLLIVHLFFLKGEKAIALVLGWVKANDLETIAAVLLFAMTYTLGSSVSRIAQDFFNDDDLQVPLVLRMAMTEDRMITSVYCASNYNHLLEAADRNPALQAKIKKFQCLKSNCGVAGQIVPAASPPANQSAPAPGCCTQYDQDSTEASSAPGAQSVSLCAAVMSPKARYNTDAYRDAEDNLIRTARDIFGLQENALLLKGQDATLRLHQLHDQIIVLRGATFNGMVALVFCLYAWGVRRRREDPRSVLRWVLGLVPACLLYMGMDALVHHYEERFTVGPPYMEFSVLVVAAAGIVLLWLPPLETNREAGIRWQWPALSLLFAVLVVGGAMGWWATEVLYGEQIIYSYDALGTAAK